MADLPNSGLAVQATQSGLTFRAPETNSALALASSLSSLTPELSDFTNEYAKKESARQSAKAYQASLSTSGESFARAVRDGKIEPTQNPWFIQAYERNSAQVRAQAQVGDLLAQSQTWAERNDPSAFSARWNKEVGSVGQSFQGIDQLAGFQAAAAPLSQQALSSNVSYNVQRIQQKTVQDTTTLMTTAVQNVFKGNPKAAPSDYYSALEPAKEQWIGTGGTEAGFNQLAVGAVIAAGTNLQDPTILNILKDDRGGKGALANIVGPTGNPVADDISKAQFYIQQAADAASKEASLKMQRAADAEGAKGAQALYDQHGYAIISGAVPSSQMIEELKAQGLSPRGAAAALEVIQKDLSPILSLDNAQFGIRGNTPEGAQYIVDMTTRAQTQGLTPDLSRDLAKAYLSRQIEQGDYARLMGMAQARTNHFESESRQDARSAKSDAAASRRASRESIQDLRRDQGVVVGNTMGRLSGANPKKDYYKDAKFRTTLEKRIADAQASYIYQNPDNPEGARQAGRDAAAGVVQQEVARLKALAGKGPSGVASSSNQRR